MGLYKYTKQCKNRFNQPIGWKENFETRVQQLLNKNTFLEGIVQRLLIIKSERLFFQ
ncbi:unnamed protein product [Paramecium octaurelia]|uniref:Uncharacterized protein n=1 Tax=Paramecium octaurelia TaxID=43137 RepID=A0A8S1TGD5_PAROT|nr:unnamed protein product [Paramecium octaurelia]